VQLSLSMTGRKAYWESKDTTALFLNIRTRWKWVVVTSQDLCHQERNLKPTAQEAE
jgi:hypothetical protein